MLHRRGRATGAEASHEAIEGRICVVMLTEDTIASLQGQTEDTGVDVFLRKPLEAAELWRAIEARLNSPPADRQRDSQAAGS